METWRLYTVIWCGLVSLAGSCIMNGSFPPFHIAFLAFIIPMMGWIAGLYLSDFLDRKLDKIEKSHRPIPSGRIHPYEALFIGAIFAGTGLILSFYLGIYNLALVFVVAFLVLVYAKISKSKGILGNINRGVVTVAAFFYGVFSVRQSTEFIPIYIWILSLVFLVHDTNSNLVGAIRDIPGDKKGGYFTIPVKYGLKNSIFISLFLTFVWYFILIGITFYYNFLKIDFYYLLSVDILIIFLMYVYLFKSINNYTRKRALKFHEFFVIERIILASALIFGIAENSIALVILILALTITVLSQILLRKRYEFEEKK
ncbi:MAG: UbiA family prenyltransferase [Candidatus Thermoplasmatota archaeon]|nr:UbiA family prenyltransferase [Candidatus Thermoplasmatota archaeon]